MKTLLVILLVCASCSFAQDIPAENIVHSVQIKWKPPVGQLYDGFHIYRADACNNFIYIKNVGQVRQFTDKAVLGGQTYTYKVRTVLDGIESVDSNVPEVTIPLL